MCSVLPLWKNWLHIVITASVEQEGGNGSEKKKVWWVFILTDIWRDGSARSSAPNPPDQCRVRYYRPYRTGRRQRCAAQPLGRHWETVSGFVDDVAATMTLVDDILTDPDIFPVFDLLRPPMHHSSYSLPYHSYWERCGNMEMTRAHGGMSPPPIDTGQPAGEREPSIPPKQSFCFLARKGGGCWSEA